MRKLAGFTLIELIVVMVILGVLAVIAAPTFLNLQSDSRTAVLEATKGALESAFQIFSLKAQVPSAEITETDGKIFIMLDGVSFGLTDDFYPIFPANIGDLDSLAHLNLLMNIDVSIAPATGKGIKGFNYVYDYNGGFILYSGITDYDNSRCFISYAPDKIHSNLVEFKGEYFKIITDGC